MSKGRGLTEKQKEVPKVGLRAERKVARWLAKHGFKDIKSFDKPHAGYFDVKARKGREKWIIEVKTGEKPQININNFVKMLKTRGYKKIGLAIVTKKDVHLLEYNKMSLAGRKAQETIRKNKK